MTTILWVLAVVFIAFGAVRLIQGLLDRNFNLALIGTAAILVGLIIGPGGTSFL